MSDAPPPANEMTPLARVLFGWTFGRRAGTFAAFALGGLGVLAIAAEAIKPRGGVRLPYEEDPGFYAAVGAVGIAALLILALVLRAIAARTYAYAEEERDGDHA